MTLVTLVAGCSTPKTLAVRNGQGPPPPAVSQPTPTTNIIARLWKRQWTDRPWGAKVTRVMLVLAVYWLAETSGDVTTDGNGGGGKSNIPRCTQPGQKFCYP